MVHCNVLFAQPIVWQRESKMISCHLANVTGWKKCDQMARFLGKYLAHLQQKQFAKNLIKPNKMAQDY